jgi:putative sterol carrier protein
MTTKAELDQSIAAMQHNFQANKASGLKLTYWLQLTGDGGSSWAIDIANGQCNIRNSAPRSADTTIIMSIPNFVLLSQGKLNVQQAYQQKQIQVTGNLQFALKFTELFPAWYSAPQPTPTPTPQPTPSGQVQPQFMNRSFDEYQPFIYEGKVMQWKEPQYPEMYGAYWDLDIVSVGDSRFHLMDSGTFGLFTQKYFGGGGHDYHTQGTHSQVITSRYQFDIVFRQTVAAQVGKNYTFRGSIVSFFKGTSTGPDPDKMFLNIGIDPTGGTDFRSGTVVWSGRDGTNNKWCYPKVQAKATTDKVTVFIRLENPEGDVGTTNLNTFHIDDFYLE